MMLAAALLLLAAQDPREPTQTPQSWRPVAVTAAAHELDVQLTTPSGPLLLRLDSLLFADRIDTVAVVAAVPARDQKGISVLLNVHAWSRGPESAMEMCGAGEEVALVWLTVPMHLPPKLLLYASCFVSREGELQSNADSLWGTVEDYQEKKELHLTYRVQQADSGVRVSEQPLPDH